ncbi:MAG: hypothetical protein EBY40_00215 [Marivivens sp.]|nr:hypothetical protein [Marivivens sp.]NBT50020.1 hypothetical protein [Marivivens sp.]NCW67032.1 hypothetical protein [Marivivens sp.]NDH01533.1 hypothetical protein [Marivivens sp.]
MASSIANLAVILSANAGQFTSGMRRAGASTQRFAATANVQIASVQGAMGALGAAARRLGPLIAAAVGGRAIFGQLDRLDEIGKTAERLGLTTEELSRLQFAGEQTGVQVNTLNMALQRMTRRVAEAAAGTGEAKDAIKELGLDAAALNAMSPAQAFAEISKAMEGVASSGDKVRLAMKLFDSEGVRLVNTLNLGSKGLEEMSRRSDELGNTIDGKTAKSAAEFNDAINELKTALGGTVKELASALIPALKSLVGILTTAVAGVNKLAGALTSLFSVNWMGEWTAPGEIRKLSEEAQRAKEETKALREEMQRLTDVASEQQLAAIFDRFEGKDPRGLMAPLDDKGMEAAERQAGRYLDMLLTPADKLAGKVREVRDLVRRGLITNADGNKIVSVLGRVASEAGRVSQAMERMAGRAKSIIEATRTPVEKFQSKLKEIQELAVAGLLDTETAKRAISMAQKSLSDAMKKPRELLSQPGDLDSRRVDFAAIGAESAVGRGQDKIEKNTADEVKESKKQTRALAEILQIGRNAQGAAITLVNF